MSSFSSIIKRFCQKKRRARVWSNQELARFAGLFSGKVINVSGWKDEDRQGRHYREYFSKAGQYFISNIEGDKGLSGLANEIFLDLEKPLDEELKKQFDVVFCHTTLEHIYHIKQAFDNLCLLSRDIVILAVPFFQEQHSKGTFGDYWRFTPQGIVRNFKERGFGTLYLSATPFRDNPIYIFTVVSCYFKKWEGVFTPIEISDGKVRKFAKPLFFCKILNRIKL